ncbi:hypothetical protein EXIGLDRAFT_721921 [Exidia glandulosa HHB12029]|uniref:DUF6699 domain-containing protein n=1 Tax=Exidia glandulosa HHB12029 TaxID=1314781 RepID=A0A165N952_EXIGL|nr:hypothetical protein EXIGLDRAFT_721921 [Exidia glandulosa HHB12029]
MYPYAAPVYPPYYAHAYHDPRYAYPAAPPPPSARRGQYRNLHHDPYYDAWYNTPRTGGGGLWDDYDRDEEYDYPRTPWSRARGLFNDPRSTGSAHPHPHRLLKYHSRTRPLNLDVAKDGHFATEVDGTPLGQNAYASAFSPEVERLRLMSEELPWMIEVNKSRYDQYITVKQVIEAIQAIRTTPISWSELVLAGRRKRDAMVKAHNERIRALPESERRGLCQVDWLEGKTQFLGIRKDDRAVKCLVEPFYDNSVETWIMVFGRE